MNQIAATILEQFGGFMALRMIGGVCHYTDSSITVPFKAKAKNLTNRLVIKLDADDTYTMEFWNCRGIKADKKEAYSMVYCDQLKEIFERRTGLYLSL